MLDHLTVSLKAVEVASTALSLLAPVQEDFPELRPSLDASEELMNCAVSRILDNVPYKPVNGHAVESTCSRPTAPVVEEENTWEPYDERDASRCKALLLEILRRAAHDWVLYRQHKKMNLRELAEDAFIWLFEEDENHFYRRQRLTAHVEMSTGEVVEGAREITSFLSICDCLDLDPETVRARVRKMDVKTIIASGRPAETRKLKNVNSTVEECSVMVNVDMDTPPQGDYVSKYEAYGMVATPSRLTPIDY